MRMTHTARVYALFHIPTALRLMICSCEDPCKMARQLNRIQRSRYAPFGVHSVVHLSSRLVKTKCSHSASFVSFLDRSLLVYCMSQIETERKSTLMAARGVV